MSRLTEKTYSGVLTIGAVLAIGGFFASGFFFVLAAFLRGNAAVFVALLGILCILCFLVGLVMIAVTTGIGISRGRGYSSKVTRHDNVKVVARYAINNGGETIFDDTFLDMDDPQTKLYVRLQLPNFTSHEYRCIEPVWYQCEEGSTGTAMIQGDWLGQYNQYRVPSRQTKHYDNLA